MAETEPGKSGDAARSGPERGKGAPIARNLLGDLPCVGCRYNLRGLSISGVCPECATPIRATILAVVDPHAAELKPLTHPRLVACGIVLWTGGAFLALCAAWAWTAGGLLPPGHWLLHAKPLTLAGIAVSFLGSLVLIRPQASVARRDTILGGVGSLLYIPLSATFLVSTAHDTAYLSGAKASTDWMLARAAFLLLVSAIAICFRPNARLLVARSLLLRSGRVDRQTLYATAGAAAAGALGTGILWSAHLVPQFLLPLRLAGLGVIIVSAILLTIGVFGALVDSVRIARAVLRPSPSPQQLFHTPGARP